MKELKANLDLYGLLLKLRECSNIFFEQVKDIEEKSDLEYMKESDQFSSGLYECVKAIKFFIGESAEVEIYDRFNEN